MAPCPPPGAHVITMFSDTHAHLYDIPEDDIKRCAQEDMDFILCVSEDGETSVKSLLIARDYSYVYPAIGIHPAYASSSTTEDIRRVLSLLEEYDVLAIGEVGLDAKYVRLPSDWEKQRRVFSIFIDAAVEHSLPLSVHSGRSFAEVIRILARRDVLAVLHWFSGTLSAALEALDAGMYFSFGPAILRGTYDALVDAVPLDRILLETDTPVKFRGAEARPWWVKNVAQHIADVKKVDPHVVVRKTRDNVRNVFGV